MNLNLQDYPNIVKLLNNINLGNKSSKDFLIKYYNSKDNYHLKFFKVIHVTGTSGKGSTCSMISKGLENSDFKVGLFTSPRLIKVNNKDISNNDLEKYLKKYYSIFPDATFPELVFLCAIDYFIDSKIDYVVLEAFVGGKNDLTNIFNPIVTVITSIGLDHQHILGHTKREILKDKLGIIWKNTPLFTPLNSKLINEEAQKIGAKYELIRGLKNTNLIGKYQQKNAEIAYDVLKYLKIDRQTINKSLLEVEHIGRLQFVKKNIIVDCAHNEMSIKKVLDELKYSSTFKKFKKKYYFLHYHIIKNWKHLIFS